MKIFKIIILALFLGGSANLLNAQIEVTSDNIVHIGNATACLQPKAEVRASSLQAGMYLYSLIVDDKLIDTKRMILTE